MKTIFCPERGDLSASERKFAGILIHAQQRLSARRVGEIRFDVLDGAPPMGLSGGGAAMLDAGGGQRLQQFRQVADIGLEDFLRPGLTPGFRSLPRAATRLVR
jgi:hypothetical protein